jgi:putative hydrolase of the HAD superfamily
MAQARFRESRPGFPASCRKIMRSAVRPDDFLCSPWPERRQPHYHRRMTSGRPLREIETWIFDLDNTLYPATSTVYPAVEERMNAFIVAALKVELDEAVALRKRFFAAHGTTLRGLMNEYGLPPKPFLDYVHELDLSNLARDERLGAALAALPGRKIIFTNATQRHAERVLEQLGLARHFAAIHDIEACAYVPKPDPSGYRALLARHAVAAERAAMIEDIASNLAPAAALGMTTIWLAGGPHAEAADRDADHVHHVVEDLAAFLAALAPPVTPAAG